MIALAIAGMNLDVVDAATGALLLAAFGAPLIYYFAVQPFILAHRTLLEKATEAAHRDPLTGLLNRREFEEHVERACASAHRHNILSALLYFDLDGFKPVNDEYGHDAGDQLLVELAGRLTRMVRVEDLIFRIGGDEFALLAHQLGDSNAVGRAAAERIGLKLLEQVNEPMELDQGIKVSVGCSIGISILRASNSDAPMYIREADLAMYKAKQDGRNRLVFSDDIGITWHLLKPSGDPENDRDHEQLDVMFSEAMHQRDETKLINRIHDLIGEIGAHFAREESRGGRNGDLQMTQAHAAEHQRMMDKFQGMERALTTASARTALQDLLEEMRLHTLRYDAYLIPSGQRND